MGCYVCFLVMGCYDAFVKENERRADRGEEVVRIPKKQLRCVHCKSWSSYYCKICSIAYFPRVAVVCNKCRIRHSESYNDGAQTLDNETTHVDVNESSEDELA